LIYLAAWLASTVLILLGGARLRVGALLAAGTSVVTFGLFFADLGTALSGSDLVRAGLVLGNLSMPTDGMVRYAESVWLGDQPPAVRAALAPVLGGTEPAAVNRFSSALPATVAAAALGLEGGSYALDAACASALYAIKLACDRLHDHSADVMVAGAVNRSDDLALHQAFSSLSALSPSGRSRPFHREADGLVPAEGCAVVTLMRLSDALAAGRRVLGVIRGIGLSNSGRSSGLLAPAAAGQIRALERAYAAAGDGCPSSSSRFASCSWMAATLCLSPRPRQVVSASP